MKSFSKHDLSFQKFNLRLPISVIQLTDIEHLIQCCTVCTICNPTIDIKYISDLRKIGVDLFFILIDEITFWLRILIVLFIYDQFLITFVGFNLIIEQDSPLANVKVLYCVLESVNHVDIHILFVFDQSFTHFCSLYLVLLFFYFI